jgi:hypothetical protein
MVNLNQAPPLLLGRAASLRYAGRIHFPKDRIGEIIHEDEPFEIFRQMIAEPVIYRQSDPPRAILKVYFHHTHFSPRVNKVLSLIPVPLIAAQPGFRSKTWLLGQETGTTQGLYEWDTVEDAENYWMSFPMQLLKNVQSPSLYSITYTKSERTSCRNSR